MTVRTFDIDQKIYYHRNVVKKWIVMKMKSSKIIYQFVSNLNLFFITFFLILFISLPNGMKKESLMFVPSLLLPSSVRYFFFYFMIYFFLFIFFFFLFFFLLFFNFIPFFFSLIYLFHYFLIINLTCQK